MRDPGTVNKAWYHEPYVWMLIVIPLSAVLVGIVMLWLALANEDGLVVDDYYRRGLEINRTLARDDAARRYALTSELRFIADTDRVHARLDAGPGFVYPPQVALGLYHATRPGLDQELTLTRIGDRDYAGLLPALAPGHWHVQLSGDLWRLTGLVRWPTAAGPLRLEPLQEP